jgi:hypothetical protein
MNYNNYKNLLPWGTFNSNVSDEERRNMKEAYRLEDDRLFEIFKKDAIKEVGLENHPAAEKAFQLAWERGHSCGYAEVFIYLEELADLLLTK